MATVYRPFILLLILLTQLAHSLETSPVSRTLNLEEYSSVLYTSGEQLSVQQANSPQYLFRYSPWQRRSFYFSENKGGAWLRIQPPVSASIPTLPILKLVSPSGIKPDVYFFQNGTYQKLHGISRSNTTLYGLPHIASADGLLLIKLPASATTTLKISLNSPDLLLDEQKQYNWQLGWLFAIFLVVIIWNSVNSYKYRHPIYSIQVLLGATNILFLSSWQGLINIGSDTGRFQSLLMSLSILITTALIARGARILIAGENRHLIWGFNILSAIPMTCITLMLFGVNLTLESNLIVYLIITQALWFCSLFARREQGVLIPVWITTPFSLINLVACLSILGVFDYTSIAAIWTIFHTTAITLIAFGWFYNIPERLLPDTPSTEAEQSFDQKNQETTLDRTIFDTMGHELRTPLNGVLGMSELMMSTQLTPRQENYLQTIRYAGGELSNLVSLLSEVWKMDNNETSLNPVPFDVSELLNNCLDKFRYRADQLGTELISYIHPNVPVYSEADVRLLSLLLEAIMSHALSHCEQSEIMVSLNHTSLLPNASSSSPGPEDSRYGFLMFQISFNCSNKPQLQAVADTFDNYREAKQQSEISLQLYIAIRLAKSLGGHIGFMGTENIHVWLAIPHNPQLNNQTIDEQSRSFNENPLKVLIVDDNKTCRQVLSQQCSLMGIKTMDAEDGRSALAMIRNEAYLGRPFDVIILDHHMPGINGIQVAEKLHEDQPESIPDIIMLTGATNPPGRQRAERLGIKQFLTKPASRLTLEKALQAVTANTITCPDTQTTDL